MLGLCVCFGGTRQGRTSRPSSRLGQRACCQWAAVLPRRVLALQREFRSGAQACMAAYVPVFIHCWCVFVCKPGRTSRPCRPPASSRCPLQKGVLSMRSGLPRQILAPSGESRRGFESAPCHAPLNLDTTAARGRGPCSEHMERPRSPVLSMRSGTLLGMFWAPSWGAMVVDRGSARTRGPHRKCVRTRLLSGASLLLSTVSE